MDGRGLSSSESVSDHLRVRLVLRKLGFLPEAAGGVVVREGWAID
jgi:hypothetical protein